LLYAVGMKPLIGINMDVEAGPPAKASLQNLYIQAVQKAGGIALAIPPMPDEDLKELVARLDGLMLIGGRDYSPSRYGEETCPKVELVEASREDFDFRLINMTLKDSAMPILGICAGAQLLNIALGGTLIQDIGSECPDSSIDHSLPPGKTLQDFAEGFMRHSVNIFPDSLLSKLYPKQLTVPTSHHQAIRDVGRGLKVTANADDQIIEALELDSRPFTIGVQWHPERDYTGNQNLFEEFIKACKTKNATQACAGKVS